MTESIAPQTPLDAATIILLRDSDQGIQTLLLRRDTRLANMAGMYVFPGGKLDAADQENACTALLDQSPASLHAALAEPAISDGAATGLHVAALREALEECGMLLAEPARSDALLDAVRARQMLHDGQGFAQVLTALGLRMATRALVPWSRWITPIAPALATRRFDTRFFLAQAPAHQHATHDNEETTASLWCTARGALERYRDGSISLAPPQIMSLAHLSRYATAAQALAAARSQRPPTIQPHVFAQDGLQMHCYPGDASHPVHERALPGPTRLVRDGSSFLPLQGFEALFD